MTQRPVVVLAGWLGCQPKNLRRYEKLYRSLGCEVVPTIATPRMVVDTLLNHGTSAQQTTSPTTARLPSISDLAVEVLDKVNKKRKRSLMSLDPSPVIFHVFSNGGCLVWEAIRQLQLNGEHQSDKNIRDGEGFADGLIFDSCPSTDLHAINDALDYCTPDELDEALCHRLVKEGGSLDRYEYFQLPAIQRQLRLRSEEFLDRLTNDDCPSPQLYLYSANDPLARAITIDGLVAARKQLQGPSRIHVQKWDDSPHVAHYIKHPDKYQGAVSSFLQFCTTRVDSPRSRL